MKMVKRLLTCLLMTGFFCSSLSAEEDLRSAELRIPMRDGYELAADLFLPKGVDAPHPCLLVRSPRGRAADRDRFAHLVDWGYAVVLQDCRSCTAQGQAALPYLADGRGPFQDGYDTVEWLAKQDFCNGDVATIGESALGITQLLVAPTAPPHLKCQYIMAAAPSLFHHAIFPGGQFRKTQVEGWLDNHSDPESFMHFVSQHPQYNEFWSLLNANEGVENVAAPALHYGGWFDTFLEGTLEAFSARQERGAEGARGQQKLVIGPWTHMWPHVRSLGDFDVPELAERPPVDFSMKRWLDHHMKEKDAHIEAMPAVTYYVMGPFDHSPSSGHCWRTADRWPVPAIQAHFFLNREGLLTDDSLNLCDYTGISYKYDPNNPCPTVGGRNLYLEAGPKDQQHLEQRDDVLTFTSGTLDEDVEVTGKVSARIFFSTDQKDTDIVAKLCDVYPDGRSILIAEGLTRLGSVATAEQINSGKPIPVDVDLWSTSMVFAKGHRLRLSITSSNYPKFEKNLNVAQDERGKVYARTATNTVHFGEQCSSRLVLPVVRRGA